MKQALERGGGLNPNPYIVQMEKMSDSLKQLTSMVVGSGTSKEKDLDDAVSIMCKKIRCGVCEQCNQHIECEEDEKLCEIVRGTIEGVEEYGVELSVAKKRELQKKCLQFEQVKEEVEQAFEFYKKRDLWKQQLLQNKEASLVAIQAFGNAIEEITQELDASIFRDDRLEKKMGQVLRKLGVRPLKIILMVSKEGRYEIQISAKAKSGVCVTIQEMAECLSDVVGMYMVPEQTEPLKLLEEYQTVIFIEKLKYNAMYGMAMRKKIGSTISGDNFLVINMPGGKKGILLSDGMGSGERAFHQSKMAIELAEALLETGMSPELIVEMVNAALTMGAEEVEFATLDLCVVDLYQGIATLIKAGSAMTYIKNKTKIRGYESTSLPLGVVATTEFDVYHTILGDETYIVMMTDGVTELIPLDLRGCYVETFLKCIKTRNPKEMANELLDGLLKLQGEEIKDDMMVLVLGVWRC